MAEHDVVLADWDGDVGERRVANRATIDPDLGPRRRVDAQPPSGGETFSETISPVLIVTVCRDR